MYYLDWQAQPRALRVKVAALVSATLLITVSAMLVSPEGMAASSAGLFTVLLAATVSSVAVHSLAAAALEPHIEPHTLAALLLEGVVGLPIAVWLLLNLAEPDFTPTAGILLVAYTTYRLLTGVSSMPGGAGAEETTGEGWNAPPHTRLHQRFVFLLQVLAILAIQISSATQDIPGRVGPLQFIPAALVGAWLGLLIFRRRPDRFFTMIVNLCLLASSFGLLAL